MDFSEAIEAYDIHSWYIQPPKCFFFYNYWRSRSFIDFCSGCLRFSVSIFFSKIVRLIETKLHVEPLLDGEWKFIYGIWIIWSRWPPCQYMVKTFENLLLRIQMADDTLALASLFKWWPLVDGHLGFCMGKWQNCRFIWSYCSLWHSKLIYAFTKLNFYNYQRSRSFTDLGQGHLLTFVLDASYSVFLSSQKLLGWLKPNYMWSPFGMGEWKFVHKIGVKWSRFSPCPYMVKTLWKFFFLRLERLKTLKLGMQNWELWPYQVYSNGDHWLTLNFFKYKK